MLFPHPPSPLLPPYPNLSSGTVVLGQHREKPYPSAPEEVTTPPRPPNGDKITEKRGQNHTKGAITPPQ